MTTAWQALRRVARLEGGERRWLALSIALSFGAVAAAAGLLTTSGYLISRAAQRPEILTLTGVIVAVRAFGIARAALRYGERLVSHDLALRVLARLRVSFFSVLAPLVPTSLRGHTSGELLSRFVGDVDALQDLYLRALAPPLVALAVIAAATLTAWLLLPAVAPVVAGTLAFAALAVPALSYTLAASAHRRQAAARAALTTEVVEAIDGGAELAVAGRGGERAARLEAAGARLASIARRDALAAAAAAGLGSLLWGLTVIAVLLVGIPAVHARALAGVLLAALVFLVLGAYEGIAPLPAAARTLRGCAEAALRLEQLSDLEPAVRDPERPDPMPAESDVELALEDVGFSYGPHEAPLLEHVTLRLKPGCRLLLTGASGAGKTTLAHLLVRFLDPTAGQTTLGGIDLRALAQDDVRRAVVLVAQDAHVFTTTIRENLMLANRAASEADLWAALNAVALDGWVASLPDRLDTLVGEDGELLSGGQRHRIALARALVADANFVILDEPTAHLDPGTAAAMIEAIAATLGRRGLLVIAHRPEGLGDFDEVRLSGGRIIVRRPPQSSPGLTPGSRVPALDARTAPDAETPGLPEPRAVNDPKGGVTAA
jgi:thiol reductant ABC exporter CydC subunit